jgi:arsenate reductase
MKGFLLDLKRSIQSVSDFMKKKVLFICSHNSARSQMAEGFLNAICGDRFEGSSAGIEPTKVNPYAVKAMAEIRIDISQHRSKSLEEFRGGHFDYVVTVCDHAKEVCPFFPGEKILHRSFEDPSEFKGTEDEILEQVRRVRAEIKEWIDKTFCKHMVQDQGFR